MTWSRGWPMDDPKIAPDSGDGCEIEETCHGTGLRWCYYVAIGVAECFRHGPVACDGCRDCDPEEM